MTFSIPVRPAVGSSLQASKWQQIPVLIDENEMEALLSELGQFWIVRTSGVIPEGEEVISQGDFLHAYEHYIHALKKGEITQDPRIRLYFSAVWTTFPEALYRVMLNNNQGLVKVVQPVIQLQAHRFDYSFADQTFRSMVMGYDSVSWGIQFSYPHLYQDDDLNVLKVKETSQFPNTALFKKLQQWVRNHTIATPFEVEGKKVNVPIRLGKKCLQWINDHPQLQAKGLRVRHPSQQDECFGNFS